MTFSFFNCIFKIIALKFKIIKFFELIVLRSMLILFWYLLKDNQRIYYLESKYAFNEIRNLKSKLRRKYVFANKEI